ncbi:MAG TPA: hypothetical protein VGV62_07165 [Xanthobacteraceae bacterium]|jgi:hypothetical protein|nr:hypothetical protein [Xanthobacteraceae bacterium]
MPRSARKTSLETRTARLANKVRHAPYFVKIAKGPHLGYYRGAVSGSWVARRYCGEGTYENAALGGADDTLDADGITVLDYWQAQAAAKIVGRARAAGRSRPGTARALHRAPGGGRLSRGNPY